MCTVFTQRLVEPQYLYVSMFKVYHYYGSLKVTSMVVYIGTVQLDLNLMLASTLPAFKIARIACAQP